MYIESMLISNDYITLYTANKQALQILNILKKYCPENYTILDANAGMGGNSVYFCKYFKFVYCVDISHNAINYLEHNLREYTNHCIINENCLDIMKIIKYDIIFFDPPWGGSSYKYKKYVNLFINNKNINQIIKELYYYDNLKIICLKVPKNYNIIDLSPWKSYIYNIYKSDNRTTLFKLIIYTKSINQLNQSINQ